MSEADLKINSKVRKVLVEANLDNSGVNVSTTSGVVLIRGEFQKFPGIKMRDRDIARMLTVIELNILRIKGVKRVTFSLDKWSKKKGKWILEDDQSQHS